MQCGGEIGHSKLLLRMASPPPGFLSVGLGETRKHDGPLSPWVREPFSCVGAGGGAPSLCPGRGQLMGVDWQILGMATRRMGW